MSRREQDGAGQGPAPLDVRVLSGSPTEEEIAAVTAVLAVAVAEEQAQEELEEHRLASAWARSQRALRGPHHPGPGRWRGFSG